MSVGFLTHLLRGYRSAGRAAVPVRRPPFPMWRESVVASRRGAGLD